MIALLKKELFLLFRSPIIYFVTALFSLLNGYVFSLILKLISSPFGQNPSDFLSLYFGGTYFFWIAQFIIFILLTMGLLSEERKYGSLELLTTVPITEKQIVCSKFFSVFIFYIFLWIPSFFYTFAVFSFDHFPWVLLLSNILFVVLVGALFLSLGLLISCLMSTPFLSAIVFFFTIMFYSLLGFIHEFLSVPFIKIMINTIDPYQISSNMTKGLLESKHLVFMLSFTFFNLYLSSHILRNRR